MKSVPGDMYCRVLATQKNLKLKAGWPGYACSVENA